MLEAVEMHAGKNGPGTARAFARRQVLQRHADIVEGALVREKRVALEDVADGALVDR